MDCHAVLSVTGLSLREKMLRRHLVQPTDALYLYHSGYAFLCARSHDGLAASARLDW